MEVKNVDLENGIAKYPITKTMAFEMPLSDFMIELLRNRIAENAEEFGANCRWVFPSATAESGHLEEEKLTERAEAVQAALVAAHAAASVDHHRRSEGENLRQPPARVDQPQAEARQERRCAQRLHPSGHFDDLRHSQQAMTDYLLAQIEPKPGKGKKHSGNVVKFQQRVRVIADRFARMKFSLRIRGDMA